MVLELWSTQVLAEIIGRVQTPIREAFSYGIRHISSVIQWSIRSYFIQWIKVKYAVFRMKVPHVRESTTLPSITFINFCIFSVGWLVEWLHNAKLQKKCKMVLYQSLRLKSLQNCLVKWPPSHFWLAITQKLWYRYFNMYQSLFKTNFIYTGRHRHMSTFQSCVYNFTIFQASFFILKRKVQNEWNLLQMILSF